MLLKTLLILALVGLVIALFKVRKSPAAFRPIAYGLVGLVLLLVVIRLFAGSRPPPPVRIIGDFHTAAAYRLGQEVARAAPGGGDIVVVFAEKVEGFMGAIAEAQLEGLKKGLGDGAYRLVTAFPPDEPPFLMTIRLLGRLARTAPEAKAIVSFMGSPESSDSPDRNLPPLFVIDMMAPQAARPLMARGLIQAGVFAKPDADWDAEPKSGMTLEEIFDLRYVLVTN